MPELVLSAGGRRYGYEAAVPDHRDFGVTRLRLAQHVPAAVDLEPKCGPKKDQKALGACTSFAKTGDREFLARKLGPPGWEPVFSSLFTYYMERKMDGTLPDDAGSNGRTSCKVAQQFGFLPESLDPYDPAKFNV